MASSSLVIRDPRSLAIIVVRPSNDGLHSKAAFLAGRIVRRGLRITRFFFALPGTVFRLFQKLLRLARMIAIAGLAGVAMSVLIAGTQAPSATHQRVSSLDPNEAHGGGAVHALILKDMAGRSLPAVNVGTVAIYSPPTLQPQIVVGHESVILPPNPFAVSNFSPRLISSAPWATVGRATEVAPGASATAGRLETAPILHDSRAPLHIVSFPPPSSSYSAHRSPRIRFRL